MNNTEEVGEITEGRTGKDIIDIWYWEENKSIEAWTKRRSAKAQKLSWVRGSCVVLSCVFLSLSCYCLVLSCPALYCSPCTEISPALPLSLHRYCQYFAPQRCHVMFWSKKISDVHFKNRGSTSITWLRLLEGWLKPDSLNHKIVKI